MILLAWKATWPTTSPVDLVPCRVRALLDLSVSPFASGSRGTGARDKSNPLPRERGRCPINPETREVEGKKKNSRFVRACRAWIRIEARRDEFRFLR